jgi:glycolate oxidase iron-sulfur subunit
MKKQGTLEKRTIREALLSIYDEVAKCNKCGFCLSTCPVYTITGEERAVARGHNVHLQNLIEGNLEMSEELKAPLFECLLCRACVDNCMSGVMTHQNVLRGRSAYVEQLGESKVLQFVFRKLLPNPKKMDFYVRLAALGKKSRLDRAAKALGFLKWFGRDRDKVLDLVQRMPFRFFKERLEELGPNPQPAHRKVAYFVGCATNYALPEVGFSTVKVLRAVGCSVQILGNVCCGLPASSYGDQSAFKNLAQRNLDIMANLDVEAIVTDCGSCSAFLKEYADLLADDPEYGAKAAAVRPKLKALSEYLKEIGLPEFKGRVEARVTYHDPCHMSRYQDLVNEPREIIRSIPGVEYQELPEADWCCGAAGTYNIAYYGQSMQVLDRKMENVKKTKADILVTTCPACYIQLAYGARKHALNCEVLDLADLIARALDPPRS